MGLLRARPQGGVAPRIGAVLIGAVAVGLFGAVAFVSDPGFLLMSRLASVIVNGAHAPQR